MHARDGTPWAAQTTEEWEAEPLERAGAPGWLAGVHAWTSYWLGWKDADPPQRSRVVVQQVQAPPIDKPIDKLSTEELKAELLVKGLCDDGKLAELRERVERARENIEEVRAQEAPKLDRRELLVRASPRQHHSPRAAPRARPVRSRSAGGGRVGSSTNPPPSIVKPLFGLRGPYSLPVMQRQKRKPPPKGQKKWTTGRLSKAAEAIARGEKPVPLKKSAQPAAGSEDDAEMAEAESEAEGGASGSGSDEMPT